MVASKVCPPGWGRLLVCTDGSAQSQGAVDAALELARLWGSRVHVLQVLETSAYFDPQAPDLLSQWEEEIRGQLEALKGRAAEKGIALETHLRRSVSPFSAILEVAGELKPEVVIMGRHGRTGLARLLMGSVTARIIGLSPVKLLVVPRGATLTFKRLLVASDGSPYSAAAWDQAFSLARHLNSELLAVCVAREEGEITMAQEILDNLMNAANREGVRLQALMPQGQPADDGIIQAVLRNNVNLIIMGSHGRTGLARLLMGSVTERVVGHSPCPVLVVKRGEE